jgi:hypothetical protein
MKVYDVQTHQGGLVCETLDEAFEEVKKRFDLYRAKEATIKVLTMSRERFDAIPEE